jgi:MinD-like ATPase involved in chromosome partitioning or flagellar assembly
VAQFIAVNAVHAGSGVSTTVANVAALLAISTPRLRVGVVDACLAAPTQHLLFGLRQAAFRFTLNDALAGRCRLDEAVHEMPVDPDRPDGPTVLLAPANPDPSVVAAAGRQTYPVEALGTECHELAAHLGLDVLLIDTDAGLPPSSLVCLSAADTALLVLALDKQHYQAAAATIAVVERLPATRRGMVVNLASPSLNVSSIHTQVTHNFGWPVAGIVPYCDELLALGSASLFGVRYPDHPVTAIFRRLAHDVIGSQGV